MTKMKKNLLFLSLLLILCISLGAVSAADISVNDFDGVNNIQNMETVQEDLSQKDVELTSMQENPVSLDELRDEIVHAKSGSTITLTKDYKADAHSDPVRIDEPLTIDGQGHTIDGSNSAQIFWVFADNVTLKNINFINAKSAIGSAISWSLGDNGVVSSCNFVNCSSSNSAGAIELFYCDNCLVTGCSFVNCSATTSGGAIELFHSTNTIVNYNIFDNNIADEGKAINVLYSSINCDFNFFAFGNNISLFPKGLVNGSTVNNWVVLKISKDNAKYFVDFVENDGSTLTKSMPDYTAKLNINEDVKEITIKNNTFKDTLISGDYLLTSLNSDNFLARTSFKETTISVNTEDIIYGDNAIVDGTVNAINGDVPTGNVTLFINSVKKVTVPINDGKFSINLHKLSVNVYNIAVVYNGDSDYLSSNATVKLTVAKVPTKFIDATNGTVYNGKYYSVRLTDGSGKALASKNVAIKIAGKTYNVKTDNNGLAKVKLAITSKYLNKALTVNYKFNGDNNLKASSGSSEIKVIKTPTKIVNATKLVVKNHKNFYVKLTTKSGKVLANKVIKMKSSVSGKIYKMKTNSKGIAKIDLWVKNKPLGKYYKYTFKYAGSSYYNSCTKTFKIKIVK